MVAKLNEYFTWAKAETRIAGFCPWHFNTRWGMGGADNAHSTVVTNKAIQCDMALGAIEMPEVVAKLREIGEYALKQSSKLQTTASDRSAVAAAAASSSLHVGC